jgi:CheY-like chemotaxis protein
MDAAGSGRFVLVVEDDLQIAAILADLLEGEGYRVATAVDGQALPLALADPPDLVLLDVMMPGMDGAEVCRRLNADPRTRDVPIVFLTAMPPDALLPRIADCAYRGLIRKPFGLDEVLDAVRRMTKYE